MKHGATSSARRAETQNYKSAILRCRWVGLKEQSLETEEGTQEYGIFNPCVTNAIYFSYEARSATDCIG